MSVERWWQRAACFDKKVDPGWFHPEQGGTPEPALKVCRRCPVQRDCLEDALQEEAARPGEPVGVRGGMTANQRKLLVRQRKKAAKPESPRVIRIRRMAAAGMTNAEMAREEGIKPGSVGAICRQLGIAARSRKPVSVGGGSR